MKKKKSEYLSEEDRQLWKASTAIITPHKKTDSHKKKRTHKAEEKALTHKGMSNLEAPTLRLMPGSPQHPFSPADTGLRGGARNEAENVSSKNRRMKTPVNPVLNTINADVAKKLKAGKRGIDARIDLHGMTQDEAHAKLFSFLRKSYSADKRMVLVITGKGNKGEGALKKNLPRWLAADSAIASIISGISPAQANHGGAGAFYVMLKKRG